MKIADNSSNTKGDKIKTPDEKKDNIYYSCIDMVRKLKYLFTSNSNMQFGGIVRWGEDNKLPETLYAYYINSVPLHTICDGIVDYVMGDGIELSPELEKYIRENMALGYKEGGNEDKQLAVNIDGDDLEDIVKQSVLDLIVLGTYTNDIYRNYIGGISELYYLDAMKTRLHASLDSVEYKSNGYSGFGYGGESANIPLLDSLLDTGNRAIFMHRNNKSRTAYPLPRYFAALDDIDIDLNITTYHKNALENGFSQFKLLFYPGTPSKEEQKQIRERIKKYYTGSCNAGGFMIIFDNGMGVKPELLSAPDDNFIDKYSALHENTENRIYTPFRAHPILFGILNKTTGFSEQEFFEVFKLFNSTLISQFRRAIKRDYDQIFGITDSFNFRPSVLEKQILTPNTQQDVS